MEIQKKDKITLLLPGLLLVIIMALIAKKLSALIAPVMALESLSIAIVLGILYAQFIKVRPNQVAGVRFGLKQVLKAGIVLLGFKLNLKAMVALGGSLFILVILFASLVLVLALLLGRSFKINQRLALLVGIGSSICGASAIVALAPCMEAEEEDAVVAVAVISLLGTIGVIAYTFIGLSLPAITDVQFGLWSGLSLQGVAHALAAAFARGEVAGEMGTLIKMTRVLLIMPLSVGLSYVFKPANPSGKPGRRMVVPVYVLLFIVSALIHSFNLLPVWLDTWLADIGSFFILLSMTAMGLSVHLKDFLERGKGALAMGSVLFIILSVAALAIIRIMY